MSELPAIITPLDWHPTRQELVDPPVLSEQIRTFGASHSGYDPIDVRWMESRVQTSYGGSETSLQENVSIAPTLRPRLTWSNIWSVHHDPAEIQEIIEAHFLDPTLGNP